MSGREKRRFFRLDVQGTAKCKFLGASSGQYKLLSKVGIDIDLVNLSPGGACIVCAGSISALAVEINCLVQLIVNLGGKELILDGRIVWYEKEESGVRVGMIFDWLAEEHREIILKYLREELRFAKLEEN